MTEAQVVLELLIANLFGDESKLGMMGEDIVTEDTVPEDWKWHRAVIRGFYEAERVGDPPTPENIALLSRLKGADTLDKLKKIAERSGSHSVRSCAIFFKGWADNKRADEILAKIGSMSGIEYGDVKEKYGLALDALLASAPMESKQSYTRISMINELETIQARRVDLLEKGQALGAQWHLAKLRELAPVMRAGDITLLTAPPKSGKAQPLDAKVMTPQGWENIGDLKVGDVISAPYGGTTQVIGVFPQGIKPIYEIQFSDGSKTQCCDEHLWMVENRNHREKGYQVCALKDMRNNLTTEGGKGMRWRIPVSYPVQFKYEALPLDPYVLGVLLGDGGLSQKAIRLSTADAEILEEMRNHLPDGMQIKHVSNYDYAITNGTQFNKVTKVLHSLGLMGCDSYSKFVPQNYLYSEIDDRISLLQGLFDTDGCPTEKGESVEYATSSKQLAEDVVFLVRSLGGIAYTKTRKPWYTYKGERKQGQISYRITAVLPNTIEPFRLKRKLELYKGRKIKPIKRAIVDVKYVGEKEAVCIKVDSPDQLYITDDFIVTHNTTTVMQVSEHNADINDTDVLVLLLETPASTLEERFLAKDLEIPPNALRKGLVDLRKDPFRTLHQQYKERKQANWDTKGRIYIQYIAGAKLSKIAAEIRTHKRMADARNRPLLVIIDYLQRIPEIGGKSTVESLAIISNSMKDFAVMYGVHILLLSQESFTGVGKAQGESRAHGSNTPIFVAQVHMALRVLNSQQDIFVGNGDQLDRMGNVRYFQRKGNHQRQSIMRYDIIRANDDETGNAYMLMENPLFTMYDFSAELDKLDVFFQKQVNSFEDDLQNPNRRLI